VLEHHWTGEVARHTHTTHITHITHWAGVYGKQMGMQCGAGVFCGYRQRALTPAHPTRCIDYHWKSESHGCLAVDPRLHAVLWVRCTLECACTTLEAADFFGYHKDSVYHCYLPENKRQRNVVSVKYDIRFRFGRGRFVLPARSKPDSVLVRRTVRRTQKRRPCVLGRVTRTVYARTASFGAT
jgi:hypothetical protein